MDNTSSANCPRCGASLDQGSVDGLCAKCLGALNFATDTALPGESVAAIPPPTPEEIAAHFPQLEVIEFLGRGGMGVVYKARQKALGRLVALKLLAPERVADPKFAERFAHEAKALAALNHPSIVTIHDFGQAGGFFYLLMEFVDGVNLRQAMKAGRFTPEQALAIVPPVCEALQYAHEHGIVHRDIKPENLLLDKDGRVKIADFGIAKMLDAEGSDVGLAESQPAGTPQYMAPEQKEHRRTDHRADIYSLGVVLYELLTGELPADKLQPPSRKVQIDVRLDDIVLRALEKTPELRYQTAGEMRTQVETFVTTPRSSHPEVQSASHPARFLKVGTSNLVTPAYLATARGQFLGYRTRGQLVLDDRQLTHTAPPALVSAVTVIPLAAIRDVSIGQYPRSMNPLGIDLLSVTYEEGGQRKQVLLSPLEGYFALPRTWNASAAEWATAIREAVTAATGRAPTTTPSEQLGVPGSHIALLTMFLMPLVPLGVFVACLIALTSPGALRHNTGLLSLFVFGMAAFGFLLVFLRRRRAKSPPGSARSLGPRRIVFGLLAFSAVLLGLAVLTYMFSSKPASGVSSFICIPVGVSNNVVIVDVNAEVASGGAEVQAVLDGPKLSPAIEAGLAETFSPPFAGTFVKPTTHVGNRPWRIWQAGPQTWRLGFALPDAALAKEAFENLRPIGPLPAQPRRTLAGTLFEVGQPGGAEYRASLNVTPPVGSADPNWVSAYAMTTYNESGVNMNWQVEASQPGIVFLHREGGQSTASLRRDPKTKLYQTTVSLELTKVGTNRVLFVSRIGGVTAREELAGSFRDLSAELLRYKNMSTKTVRGAEIELCQFQGKPVTVQVPVLISTVTTPATVKAVSWSFLFVGVIGLCVIAGVVVVLLMRRGWSAGKVLLLLGGLLLVAGIAIAVFVWGAGRHTTQAVAKPAPVSRATVESARTNLALITARFNAGPADRLAVLEAEQNLHWAEAMFAGDRKAAAIVRRDGAKEKVALLEVKYKSGKVGQQEMAAAETELAEAEAALATLEAAPPAAVKPAPADDKLSFGPVGLFIGLGVIAGVVLLIMVLARKGGTFGKVVAILVGLALLVAIPFGIALLSYLKLGSSDAPKSGHIELPDNDPALRAFPSGAHIGGNHHSVLVIHDKAKTALHYVLYYAGDFDSSSSGSQNIRTRTWADEGAVKLKNGRTFGYRREALYPDELHVNGKAYDLRKGRVLVLHDDGTLEQVESFPALPVARDPEALAKQIAGAALASPLVIGDLGESTKPQRPKLPEGATLAVIADPLPAIELKVAQEQLEKVLSQLQETEIAFALLPSKTGLPEAEQRAEVMKLQSKLTVLEDQANELRARIRHRAPKP